MDATRNSLARYWLDIAKHSAVGPVMETKGPRPKAVELFWKLDRAADNLDEGHSVWIEGFREEIYKATLAQEDKWQGGGWEGALLAALTSALFLFRVESDEGLVVALGRAMLYLGNAEVLYSLRPGTTG